MPTAEDITALWVTLRLAFFSTSILLLVGTPLAWWLARTKRRWKGLIEAVIALPLVLPPTVLGFYLLVVMSPEGALGRILQWIGIDSLAFSFEGLLLGAVIHSLPFVVQPLQTAFMGIGQRPLEVAAMLRAGPIDRFFSVVVPMAAPGFYAAAVLGFAHVIGEFGVVLMIGGSLSGETRVLSIALYEHVESLDYVRAHWLAGILLLGSFGLLLPLYIFRRGFRVYP